ncbi:adenosylmethionine--8-amino-7-oxononanoate transaminase [Hyphomicrobium sp.]|uniref:adenosylmethionine--8-amino-7-oxononanoate transaminase n=1 Tax=Hyphomicrobium sp. TaxID=82 RepID=UPI002D79FECE|nr:adenosylmethionine--8-amino-7-oxononanoate transaminase [Hyphomicrobium sp.]HET6391086.1 adenosylmethionine--8-amino-7-oxononanoate transaminase [Hyphomicrobium sp.]
MTSSSIWHPFTQHGLEPAMTPIARAAGAWLETPEGKRIFDGVSSWWVITHGHRHPKIIAAMRAQTERLDQVIFAGFTHEPAEAVADGLLKIAPEGLRYLFFSDSGSTSVEVALKMALGYWKNTGQSRSRILALEDAYHGDTIGTMSAGARGVFNAAYEPLLFEVGRIPRPKPHHAQPTFDALEIACRRGDVAAFICEPLILGAGGMLMYDADTLKEMHRICKAHDVLFIADEVMTCFGRTGTVFACQQAGIPPDILCLAKGLTGGSIPLAVTMCSAPIYDAHFSKDRSRTFFHSSSYTANPIACAAAAANLEVWRTEPVIERILAVSQSQALCLNDLAADARFVNLRQTGTITAFEIADTQAGYLANVALDLRARLLERGVLLRPLGSTVYVMPPYCTTKDELQFVYRSIVEAVDEVLS